MIEEATSIRPALESSRAVIAKLEAQYHATLQAAVRQQLETDPRVDLFTLSRLDTCVMRLPDSMTAEDFDSTTLILGAAPLRSLLGGTFAVPETTNLRAYWSGEQSGSKAIAIQELTHALEKLQKILAFLKALVSVLTEEKKKYEQLTQAGGTDGVDEATMSKPTEALRVIEDVLYDLDGRAIKPRIANLESLADTLNQYVAEKEGAVVQDEVTPPLPSVGQAS